MQKFYDVLIERLETNYWLIPGIMVTLAAMLGLFSRGLDALVMEFVSDDNNLLYISNADGARSILSTIAGSMITVAGTVFSLTMVVLSLTSQQHGPLTLNSFLRDRGNQFVLGTFTATFTYCILVLRAIDPVDSTEPVPFVSGLIGIGLAVLSLAVLIYFINHVSSSIRAPSIIAGIQHDLHALIDQKFEPGASETIETMTVPPKYIAAGDRLEVISQKEGYIQAILDQQIVGLAEETDSVIRIERTAGSYIIPGTTICTVWTQDDLPANFQQRVNNMFVVGHIRTQASDVLYVLDQIASIAVRALSPGVNDPYTAMIAVDHISGALGKLANRKMGDQYHLRQGTLRLVDPRLKFRDALRNAFDPIRQAGRGDVQLMTHLLRALIDIQAVAQTTAHRALLHQYINVLYEDFYHEHQNEWDRREIQALYERVQDAPPVDEPAQQN